jgi:hypothetical protein
MPVSTLVWASVRPARLSRAAQNLSSGTIASGTPPSAICTTLGDVPMPPAANWGMSG